MLLGTRAFGCHTVAVANQLVFGGLIADIRSTAQ
jgi:hypothetical protein